MLQKSLSLYPLPGVEALHTHAKGKLDNHNKSNNNHTTTSQAATANGTSSTSSAARSTTTQGLDGRAYSVDQVQIVKKVLAAKEGGRGAHYRVLDISSTATEAEIKKAYRKLSLKVHPDKNSAPHADEAFKVVGLAYATLSDPQKRSIYDRYGEEDPDNRGGGGGGGVHMRHRGGQEMSPEDIFNAFFGGGMPGGGGGGAGGPGVHFYSTGFGPGMHFRAGGGGGGGIPRRQQQQQPDTQPGIGMLLQLLPVLLFVVLSFLSQSDTTHGSSASSRPMAGENQYFSLTVSFTITGFGFILTL